MLDICNRGQISGLLTIMLLKMPIVGPFRYRGVMSDNHCYGLNCVPTPDSYVKSLNPQVTLLGDVALRRSSG